LKKKVYEKESFKKALEGKFSKNFQSQKNKKTKKQKKKTNVENTSFSSGDI
jgi:hypothetical protein